MAWISVHESIIGKKLRSLSKAAGCSQNEAIGLLVRLWLWGIKNADRTGLIIDADKDDVAAVLTNGLDRNIKAGDVVEAMIKTEWIDDEDDKLYLHDWEEWQKYWYKLIDESSKATERKRRQRERERKEKSKSAELKDACEKETTKKSEKKAEGYSAEFEELWSVYPYKRGNKAKAARSFNARLKEKWTKDQLIAATLGYADACMKKRTEEQYVMHASRFLGPDLEFEKFLPRNMRRGNENPAGNIPGHGTGLKPVNPALPNDDDPYAGWR